MIQADIVAIGKQRDIDLDLMRCMHLTHETIRRSCQDLLILIGKFYDRSDRLMGNFDIEIKISIHPGPFNHHLQPCIASLDLLLFTDTTFGVTNALRTRT